ncbi:MAG: nuclear transport factor 2 family protein [Gammaproteobacteria bacterium]
MNIDASRAAALDALLDRQAIMDCLARYARAIDRHDTELLRTVYHPGAIDDHTMYVGPGTEFGPVVNEVHDQMWSAHQHYVTNVSIELDGDEAHVESYWLVAGRRRDGRGADVAGGRYVDRFARRDGRWAIAARICVYEWAQDAEAMAVALTQFPIGAQDHTDLSYMRPLVTDPDRLARLGKQG